MYILRIKVKIQVYFCVIYGLGHSMKNFHHVKKINVLECCRFFFLTKIVGIFVVIIVVGYCDNNWGHADLKGILSSTLGMVRLKKPLTKYAELHRQFLNAILFYPLRNENFRALCFIFPRSFFITKFMKISRSVLSSWLISTAEAV